MARRAKRDRYWDPYIAGVLLGILLFATFFLTGHGLGSVSYTHLTLPTICFKCRSRWSPYH